MHDESDVLEPLRGTVLFAWVLFEMSDSERGILCVELSDM